MVEAKRPFISLGLFMILKKVLKSPFSYIFLLMVLMLPLYLPLLGDSLIQGHDSLAGLIRALCMEKYWGQGQFIIRWSPEVNFGYGSPIFDFYPPFFYYLTLIISKITQNTILAINISCALIWILSAVGMYLFSREFWGDKGGFLSAILYVYSPYFVQDFYVRGAFSEFMTFMIFPFLMLSIYKINQKVEFRYIFLGVISAFISILTHGMGVFINLIALLYAVFLFFFNKDFRALFSGFFVILAGFSLSAFYWLPALWDTQFLNLNFLISMRYDFHKNFISLGQLFSLPWEKSTMSDNLNFQMGLIPILLLVLSIVIILKILNSKKSLGKHYFFFLGIGVCAVFFTLPVSSFIWEHMNILKFIQLPWRFLTIIVFTISFLAGCSVMIFSNNKVNQTFLILTIFLIILSPYKYYSSAHFQHIDQDFLKSNLASHSLLGEGERTPKWITIPPNSKPLNKFETVLGDARLGEIKSYNPIHFTVNYQATTASLICFHTFYFPGWKVFIDHQSIDPYVNNPFGVILFKAPLGQHEVQVVFGTTTIRWISMLISWVSLILMIFGLLCLELPRRRKINFIKQA